jgi:glyoxylase-like metal-dependent hydrolase (beta-lactamase superfamily II)
MTAPTTCFICTTCGTQYAPAPQPPERCKICDDDRQHVGWDGQHWTTHDALAAELHVRIEADHDLLGVGVRERFAIPQRALLVPTADVGNVLWDCTSVVTADAVARLNDAGGVDLIAISHPHFYASMVEWSDAFGGVPILLHAADEQWINRRSPAVRTWDGDRLALSPTVSLLHLPGHFPGSAALHWSAAPGGRAALLTGDSLHVAGDRRHVTVMHSVPNYIPVGASTIVDLQRRLAGIAFDDLYGFTWGLNIVGGADQAVTASLDRYLQAIAA